MASVEFIDNGNKTTIQCNENDKLEDIIQRYCLKAKKDIEKMIFLYSGNIINKKKTFKELANSDDKQRKIITIVIDNKSTDNQNLNQK